LKVPIVEISSEISLSKFSAKKSPAGDTMLFRLRNLLSKVIAKLPGKNLELYMKLFIYSLKKTLFEGEVESLTCDTANGQITILNNHEPLITILKEGLIKIVDKNQKADYIQTTGGFLEIRSSNEVRCIIDQVITQKEN